MSEQEKQDKKEKKEKKPAAAGAEAGAPTRGGGGEAKPHGKGGGGGENITIAADKSALKFDKSTLDAKAGKVTITMDNPSSVPHAVEVEGNGVEEETKTLTQGKASVSVDLKAGKYEFYCPVDGHREAGMEGTLTVG